MFEILIRVSSDRLEAVLEYLQSEGLEVTLCPRSDLFEAEDLAEKTPPEEALSSRVASDVLTIGEIIEKKEKEILRIKNFKEKCLDEVKRVSAEMRSMKR